MTGSPWKALLAFSAAFCLVACFRSAPPLEDDEEKDPAEQVQVEETLNTNTIPLPTPTAVSIQTPTPTPAPTPTSPNNAPLIMQISNQTMNEQGDLSAISFRVFDFDDSVTCKDVQPISDNPAVITTALPGTDLGSEVQYGDIKITGGSTTQCGINIHSGYASSLPVKITLRLSDGKSTSESNFNVQVNSTNTAPYVVVAGQTSRTTNEDTAVNILLPQYSDDTRRGTPATMTFQIVSNPSKGTLGSMPSSAESSGTQVSYTPTTNANGNDAFSYKVCDNDPGISKCSSVETVNITITPVNDAPTISSIANQSTSEGLAKTVAFTVDDVDGALSCVSANLSYTSSNTSLVPSTSAVTWGGTWPNCYGIINPATNANGTSTISFSISDGNLSSSASFLLTVSGINHAPTMNTITSTAVNEDTAATINFTVSDQDASYACTSTYLSYTSGDTSKVAATGAVTWSGTWPNCTGTVTPVTNANGAVNLTFTVTDSGGLTASRTFSQTFTAVNDTPTGTISCAVPPATPSTNSQVLVGKSGSWALTCSGASDVDGDALTYTMELQSSANISGMTCASSIAASQSGSNFNFSGNYASSPNYGTCIYKVKACDSSAACTALTSNQMEITSYQLTVSASKPTLDANTCTVSSTASVSRSGNLNSLNYSANTGVTGATAQTGNTASSTLTFSNSLATSFLIASPPVRDSSQTGATASFNITSGVFAAGTNGGTSVTSTSNSTSYSINRTLELPKTRTLSDYAGVISESSISLDGYQPDYETTSGFCRLCYSNLASVSAASTHSCMIDGSTLKCWGKNASSQLGNGSTSTANWPQSGTASSFSALQVSAGFNFTCALGTNSSAKEIRCAGDNSSGQLGRASAQNTFTNAISFPTNHTPVAISASRFGTFACAIVNDTANSISGKVFCWGENSAGQLGNGSTSTPSSGSIVQTSNGAFSQSNKNIFALATGARHTCAVQYQGSNTNAVYCWGEGSSGKLGNNSLSNSTTPAAVDATQLGSNVLQIAAGDSHTCALNSAGELYCWGDNSVGQLGTGNTTSSSVPVHVTGLTGVTIVQVTAGANHTCALAKDFSLYCWGLGSSGQLGVGSVTTSDGSADDCNPQTGVANVTFCKKTPTQLTFPVTATVVSVSAGEGHACAVTVEGVPYCWGLNSDAQLGTSSTTQVSTPAYVCSTSSKCINTASYTSLRPKMCSKYQIP